ETREIGRSSGSGPKFLVPGAALSSCYGKMLYVTLGDDVRLCRATFSGKKLAVPDAICAAFSPDERWLVIGSSDKKIRQFDVFSEKEVGAIDVPGAPLALAFAKSSRRFACA